MVQWRRKQPFWLVLIWIQLMSFCVYDICTDLYQLGVCLRRFLKAGMSKLCTTTNLFFCLRGWKLFSTCVCVNDSQLFRSFLWAVVLHIVFNSPTAIGCDVQWYRYTYHNTTIVGVCCCSMDATESRTKENNCTIRHVIPALCGLHMAVLGAILHAVLLFIASSVWVRVRIP